MGILIDGKWTDKDESYRRGGAFVRPEAPVSLGNYIAQEITALAQPRLKPVERLEKLRHRQFIHLLLGGEAAAIDAVVQRLVDAGTLTRPL